MISFWIFSKILLCFSYNPFFFVLLLLTSHDSSDHIFCTFNFFDFSNILSIKLLNVNCVCNLTIFHLQFYCDFHYLFFWIFGFDMFLIFLLKILVLILLTSYYKQIMQFWNFRIFYFKIFLTAIILFLFLFSIILFKKMIKFDDFSRVQIIC